MERNGILRELVQEKKKELTRDEIFGSAFYQEMLLSVAGELTGGTLKKVELMKLPESDWAEPSAFPLRILILATAIC